VTAQNTGHKAGNGELVIGDHEEMTIFDVGVIPQEGIVRKGGFGLQRGERVKVGALAAGLEKGGQQRDSYIHQGGEERRMVPWGLSENLRHKSTLWGGRKKKFRHSHIGYE